MNIKKVAVIKEEYVAITGNYEEALILNQFIYWSQRVKDFDLFISEENLRRNNEGIENIDLNNGWIYKTMEELSEELMTNWSKTKVSRLLNNLIEKGYIDRRNNPKYKWDKTYQYRVNLLNVIKSLFEQGYTIDEYKVNLQQMLKLSSFHFGASISQNETSRVQIGTAIPENTIENTNREKDKGESADNSLAVKDKDTIVALWNEVANQYGLNQVRLLKAGTTRYNMLKARIDEYSLEEILEAINNIKSSPFLQGKNDRAWTIDFEWFVRPNNFPKVLEGNYIYEKKEEPRKTNGIKPLTGPGERIGPKFSTHIRGEVPTRNGC